MVRLTATTRLDRTCGHGRSSGISNHWPGGADPSLVEKVIGYGERMDDGIGVESYEGREEAKKSQWDN